MMDEERREHVQKMKKMEAEMEQVFEMKVKEKMQKLKDSENDVSSIFSIVLAGCRILITAHRCRTISYKNACTPTRRPFDNAERR